ncbi:MAG: MCE family protein, partial [Thermoleophilum sp.]|nr:MCE family protein [Thermoleophilum sp.]
MIKQAPSIGRILVMVGFALSVFAMLLFLWVSFGGGLPLRPKGYQVHVAFPEATQLAEEAEVRISGVRVGRVKSKEPDPRTGLTDTTLEIEPRFAPIPRDARAILRQKTLLGETYVELTPGHRSAGFVPDGGRLPRGNVGQTVELDEILRTLDPETRRAFQTWLDQQGRAVENRGPDINAALASLAPFADKTDEVLAILRREEAATRQLVRDTGEVFDALSERSGQLRGLIANSNKVFETTARRDRQLEEAIRAFPTFLDESRVTVERLSRFARDTDPLVNQLRP